MRIGFIGLGNMGGPMALNLMKAGHALVVHDVRKGAATPHLAGGATWADSPKAAATGVELVLTSLPGPPEVEAVALGADGIVHGAARGTVYADTSTSSPTLIRRVHALFAERGVPVLDAPVSGGVTGAQKGTLQVMVGGDETLFRKLQPVLAAFGPVGYMGAIGAGTVAKLVHNMIGTVARAAVAEGFTLGVKAGVRPEALLAAVRGGSFGQGLLLSQVLPQIVFRGDFDTVRFPVRLVRKDLGLALDLAREYQVPMALAALAEQDLLAALARGWGEKDYP
ncbi:MAG TPA: NAD(P)-dependent oxidoreductase, partial [Vicinamibacteria bacterium]|nr:NAD(P)-dependent oxidoreductase [Vicinamibacteria bacterium]